MSKALLFFGAIGAGAAALYLMDEKEGKKRRAHLRKRFEKGLTPQKVCGMNIPK